MVFSDVCLCANHNRVYNNFENANYQVKNYTNYKVNKVNKVNSSNVNIYR